MGLGQAFGFQRDWNTAAIMQFYATCFFGSDKTVTWMTADTQLTATYDQFVAALGFADSGFKIHNANKHHKPMTVNDCLCLITPPSELSDADRARKPNDVSLWKSPFDLLYQCVLRSLYPKIGDRSTCSSYAIDVMHRMATKPSRPINIPHFLWHEIRLSSIQYKRTFPHAPFIMALIQSRAPLPLEITHRHTMWTIPEHMYADADPTAGVKPVPRSATVAAVYRQETSRATAAAAPMRRIAQFLGKAQSAMMRAVTFNCTHNHDVVTRLIVSKNELKARLRASGDPTVSDDEPLPPAPPADLGFDFPSGPEWSDFYPRDPGAGGSGTHHGD